MGALRVREEAAALGVAGRGRDQGRGRGTAHEVAARELPFRFGHAEAGTSQWIVDAECPCLAAAARHGGHRAGSIAGVSLEAAHLDRELVVDGILDVINLSLQ